MSDPTLQELDALEATLNRQLEDLKKADPFYFYEPSTGAVTPDAAAFLKEYLREEDIPQKTEGQINAHLCTAQTILVAGGNRAGKSLWLVIEMLIHATGEIPDSLKDVYPVDKLPEEKYRMIRMMGESDQQLDDVLIPMVRYWVPRNYLIHRSWEESYSAKAKILTLMKDGLDVAKIQFNSYTQEVSRLQGKKLTAVFYDEEPPRKMRDENLMRMATAKRLHESYALTPTKGIGWVRDEILLKQGPTVRAFKLVSVTNQLVGLDVLRMIMDKIPGYEARKMRLLGEFVSLTGLIYGQLFNRDLHVVKPFPVGCTCKQIIDSGVHHHQCPYRKYMVIRGGDVHSVTPPAFVEVAVDFDNNWYVCGVYNPKETPDIDQLKEALQQRVDERKYRLRGTIVDRSLNYAIAAASGLNLYKKLIRGKNRVRPCYLSEKFSGSIAVGVDELKTRLKNNEVTGRPTIFFFDIPEVYPLLNDLETLERDQFNNEDRKGPKDKILEGRAHRHAALRYLTQRRWSWRALEEGNYVPPDEDDEAYI